MFLLIIENDIKKCKIYDTDRNEVGDKDYPFW